MIDGDVFYEAHRQPVFRYLARMLGADDVARDLTQEVFLRVTRHGLPACDSAGRRAWVFRVARNLALNHLRDRGRRPETPARVEVVTPPTQELRLALDRALAALGDVDRDVFVLREIAGLTYEEIARACDLSQEGVRARLHRSRARLREWLKDEIALQRAHGVRFTGSDHDD